MATMNVTDARSNWSRSVDRVAHHGERILIRRQGKDVAALVPAEDVKLLELLEDKIDLADAYRRLSDGQKPIPYDQIRAELGLD